MRAPAVATKNKAKVFLLSVDLLSSFASESLSLSLSHLHKLCLSPRKTLIIFHFIYQLVTAQAVFVEIAENSPMIKFILLLND